MRETPFSNCEKEFILSCIAKRLRLDGRQAYDYRKLKITFGIDRGCCHVQLGDTLVMAQVSCEVTQPKSNRPTDGVLFVNVELSPMASPGFESGRLSDFGVEINRLLERCIKESRCIDTESLCIIAGEKVWQLRIDIHTLNHEGNLIDASSIAAIAALAHFRRPDVSVSGEEVTVHPVTERDPIPLSLLHMPLCATFAFFDQGKFLLVDPTYKEEAVMNGKMVIAMNKHREICTLQMTGDMMLLREQVLRCSNMAAVKVGEITQLIQKALENDANARANGAQFGFAESITADKVTTHVMTEEPIVINSAHQEARQIIDHSLEDMETDDIEVRIKSLGTGEIGVGGDNTWGIDEGLRGDSKAKTNFEKPKPTSMPTGGDLSGDSEEETTMILSQEELGLSSKSSPRDPVSKKDSVKKSKKVKKKKT